MPSHYERILHEFECCLGDFQYNGSTFFTEVGVWRPEILFQHGSLSARMPFAGIELTAQVTEQDEPTSKQTYGITVYMIFKWSGFTTGSEVREQLSVAMELGDWLRAKLPDHLNNELGTGADAEILISVTIAQRIIAAEDLVFRANYDLLTEGYGASQFSITIITRTNNP